MEGPRFGRPFIPARLSDNPYLDVAAYRQSLSHLDPITRLQIEEGDWDAIAEGHMFRYKAASASASLTRSSALVHTRP